jgi:pimeloyl-ACP methyl ester carboxylesterase
MRRAVKEIKAKILWIHDEDDQVSPLSDALKIRQENYSHIQFVITKGLGHSRIYRDRHVISQVVDFL